jgi:hypothetical protein
MRRTGSTLALVMLLAMPAHAQLAADWMVAASAHIGGVGGTFWRTDLSLHNPQEYDLPVVVQLLPSDTVNWEAPPSVTLSSWETVNLWDVLARPLRPPRDRGPLVYADTR